VPGDTAANFKPKFVGGRVGRRRTRHHRFLVPLHSDYNFFGWRWTCTCEIASGVFGGEHPLDAGTFGSALALPCGDLRDETVAFADATVQALATQDPDLDLDHVEPAGVLGV